MKYTVDFIDTGRPHLPEYTEFISNLKVKK